MRLKIIVYLMNLCWGKDEALKDLFYIFNDEKNPNAKLFWFGSCECLIPSSLPNTPLVGHGKRFYNYIHGG